MLLHLPDGDKPEQVRDALAEKIQTLPDSVRRSLTGTRTGDARTETRRADLGHVERGPAARPVGWYGRGGPGHGHGAGALAGCYRLSLLLLRSGLCPPGPAVRAAGRGR